MNLDARDCQHFERALSLEWLEPNGRGGFASGTVAGPNTRRYHALLLIARHPPAGRITLVNHLEEWVEVGGKRVALSTNCYPDTVYPDGYTRCVSFSTEPWPTWVYDLGGPKVVREIFCPQGRDLVVVRWTLVGASTARLFIRPMLSGRDYHAVHHENRVLWPGATVRESVIWHPYGGLPAVRALSCGQYRHAPDWYRRVHYPVERERGLEDQEDWWSPGEFTVDVVAGRPEAVVFTTEPVDRVDVDALAHEERRRREGLTEGVPGADPLVRALWRATAAYLVDRGSQKTVLAGYPWFTEWGRDTFIALPGLCLVTGRFEVARDVIEAFAASISQGMVPNWFPETGERPEYNAIDASLWFVHAVGRYRDYTCDEATVREIGWPAVRAILDGYRQGTRYGIRLDTDGLITSHAPDVPLTWMDAKVGDWVVTPRHGKPIEIQALWVRALEVGRQLATRFGEEAYAKQCEADRRRAIRSIRARFWYEPGGYLYDVVDGERGEDASLRPNQIYAVALSDEVLDAAQAKRVVEVVRNRLLTPVGLRTLAPDDPRYRPRYEGGVLSRDGAYHQGTVWPFLLGPFITAWVRVHGGSREAKREARTFLDGLEAHLNEGCLGQISEICDAEPPHRPRGCFAQAWSVAEPLRALIEDLALPDAC